MIRTEYLKQAEIFAFLAIVFFFIFRAVLP